MITKEIIYFRKKMILACDKKCDKAWGISKRKNILLDIEDEDDIAFLSDNELGVAPLNPGTYEGGDGKPIDECELLNKWCCRECERSSLFNIDEEDIDKKLKDFSNRLYSISVKHIYLNFEENETHFKGFDEGKDFYEKYLKNKIHLGRKHIIKIDSQIKDISLSFINGLIEGASLNNIKKSDLREIIEFKGKKNIIEKIEIALS